VRIWTLVLIAASVAACTAEDKMTADLREDLALASSSEGLALASAANASTEVVGEVEQVARRKPQPAPSRRAPRPRRAPLPPIQAEPQSDGQSDEIQVAAVEPEPQPTEDRGFDGMGTHAIPTPRPQPVETSGSGTVIYAGGGSGLGSILGGIGIAVIRGGGVIDRCDPRTDGRIGGRRIQGTFGGITMPGRISGPVVRSGGSTMAINDRTPRGGSSRGSIARGGRTGRVR
jgi:hypothetical protein